MRAFKLSKKKDLNIIRHHNNKHTLYIFDNIENKNVEKNVNPNEKNVNPNEKNVNPNEKNVNPNEKNVNPKFIYNKCLTYISKSKNKLLIININSIFNYVTQTYI